jgi:hypothetical protein
MRFLLRCSLLVLALAAACNQEPEHGGSADASAGFADAATGSQDAAPSGDGGPPCDDAGVPDGGAPDAGPVPDAGEESDAAPADAGLHDGGVRDPCHDVPPPDAGGLPDAAVDPGPTAPSWAARVLAARGPHSSWHWLSSSVQVPPVDLQVLLSLLAAPVWLPRSS